jgi:hypothetical protein
MGRRVLRAAIPRPTSTSSWLSDLVLSDKMLNKIVFAIACMIAVRHAASPIFKLSVSFILVSNPIGLSFE